jgi:hypothetical protein
MGPCQKQENTSNINVELDIDCQTFASKSNDLGCFLNPKNPSKI